MRTSLKWLHLSDIHFNSQTKWKDSIAREGLLRHLETLFGEENSVLPDFIFCSGDIAFGEATNSRIEDQYKEAIDFFERLREICGQKGNPLPKEHLFVVPGNHDVNRKSINQDAQATLTLWATKSRAYVGTINTRFESKPQELTDALQRLNEYGEFIKIYLPHQHDPTGRHTFAKVVDVEGLKVGIAGFNTAWSCAGPEDDRTVWLAAEWQFNSAVKELKDAHIRIGVIHHPLDWLNEAEREITRARIFTDYDFWLHGHTHSPWVVSAQENVTITAGAVGAEVSEEFGINIVELDISNQCGAVHLYKHKAGGISWTIAPVDTHAPSGVWQLKSLPQNILAKVESIVANGSAYPEKERMRIPIKLGDSLEKLGVEVDLDTARAALFTVYNEKEEKFYLERKIDIEVESLLKGWGVWVYGPCGTGKTSTILRCLSKLKQSYIFIDLSIAVGKKGDQLLETLYSAFQDCLQGQDFEHTCNVGKFTNVIEKIAQLLTRTFKSQDVVIYIDEIPITEPSEFENFFEKLVAVQIRVKNLNERAKIKFIFSTITEPKEFLKVHQGKITESLKFYEVGFWTNEDLKALLNLICVELKLTFEDEVEEHIITSGNFTPRYLKNCIRNLLHMSSWTLERVITETVKEVA